MTAGQQMQVANRQLVQLLSAWFQSRREASFAWSRAVSEYLALPALRAFWPMSSVDYTAANRALDIAGGAYHLTDNNTVEFNYDGLAPYVQITATNTEYLSRVDGGAANWSDFTGLETFIASGVRGFTTGAWIYLDSLTGSSQAIISKFGAVGNRSYQLYVTGAGDARFLISVDGTALTTVTGASISLNAWHHIVGRFDPSTELAVFVDGIEATNIVAIPASIFDSTADFRIGANAVPSDYFDGRISMAFPCAAYLSDAIILSLFEHTKAMFGVI